MRPLRPPARGRPGADVERIAALFVTFSIGEGAYLRMASRDAWLRELHERGRLSEMQFFVVRDVFERVAAVNDSEQDAWALRHPDYRPRQRTCKHVEIYAQRG